MPNIGKLIKQAAQAQQRMQEVQAQLASRTVEATIGGGAVKVTARCDGSIAAIKIDPKAVNPADAQLLEDMVLSAVNQAIAQASAVSTEEMKKATKGFDLPGLM
jgi:DNA-binding YbaB/EbfC family protein